MEAVEQLVRNGCVDLGECDQIEDNYAPFGQAPADRTISPEVLGITDPLAVQIRTAAFQVGKGDITVDEAVAMCGSFA